MLEVLQPSADRRPADRRCLCCCLCLCCGVGARLSGENWGGGTLREGDNELIVFLVACGETGGCAATDACASAVDAVAQRAAAARQLQ